MSVSSDLDCILAGEVVENPTELLGSERFLQLLKSLSNKYSLIFIDCPPVLPVTDAVVICKRVDGVVVITYGGKTKIRTLETTLDALKSTKCNIYGIIINKIPNSREAADYGYKSGYAKYHKRYYGFGLKRRGYVPYGPYDPKYVSDKESKAITKKASDSTDMVKSDVEEALAQIIEKVNRNSVEKRKFSPKKKI